MPQIGWFEILIIVSIAIIIVGPKDFPVMLKKIVAWIAYAKTKVHDIKIKFTKISDEKFDSPDDKAKNENKEEVKND